MNFLLIGDVVGRVGRLALQKNLPYIKDKFKEYVPTYDKICINSLISTKLKEIRFQGKPPST